MMDAVASPVTMQRALAPEEAARGDFYALLSRLLHDAPDAALLQALAGAASIPPEGNAALARSWQALVDASSVMDVEAGREEFEALFAGVGKSAVSLYAGFYAGAPSIDHPRVRIQADLASLGLAHRVSVTEPEDHFAAIFEAMRFLVKGSAARAPAGLAEQRRFFRDHVEPGAAKFLEALANARQANYYRTVAALGAAFLALESESFSLD